MKSVLYLDDKGTDGEHQIFNGDVEEVYEEKLPKTIPNLKEKMQELIKILPKKELEVITKRFGLDGNAPQTLSEVGKIFKVQKRKN